MQPNSNSPALTILHDMTQYPLIGVSNAQCLPTKCVLVRDYLRKAGPGYTAVQ